MQALIAIENTVTVSTDYEIFLFAGVVLLYRPINKEGGGPKYRYAYVTIRGKSGTVYCTEREQNSIYIIKEHYH